VDTNTLRTLQAQNAADRRVAVGLGDSFANPFSFSPGIALPTGVTLYVVDADRDSGTAFAGGGSGTAPRFYRIESGQPWRDITASLPPDATADVRAIAHEKQTWWIGGQTAAGGGWLAVTTDDGRTWTSLTTPAGIRNPVLALADNIGLILYVGCAGGELHRWLAPAAWTDLTLALGFGPDDIHGIALDGATGVLVVGGAAVPAVTCKHSATAGATWTDCTPALGLAAPVRFARRACTAAFVVGGDTGLKATYDSGAHWEDWATHPDLQYLFPLYDLDFMWSDEALLATHAGLFSIAFRGAELLPLAKQGATVRAVKFTVSRIYLATDILAVSTTGGSVVSIGLGVSRTLLRPAYATRLQGAGAHVVRYGAALLISVLISTSDATPQDIIIYDHTTAAGPIIARLHLPANAAPFEWRPTYPVRLAAGLTIVLATANQDCTVVLE
jgi:hypothetical protein